MINSRILFVGCILRAFTEVIHTRPLHASRRPKNRGSTRGRGGGKKFGWVTHSPVGASKRQLPIPGNRPFGECRMSHRGIPDERRTPLSHLWVSGHYRVTRFYFEQISPRHRRLPRRARCYVTRVRFLFGKRQFRFFFHRILFWILKMLEFSICLIRLSYTINRKWPRILLHFRILWKVKVQKTLL